MVKGRKGWWRQIQSGEYPDTQKKYGDSKWIDHSLKKSKPVKGKIENKPISLQNDCPNCGKLYWVDKGKCFNCGWPNVSKRKLEKKREPVIPKKEVLQKTEYKPQHAVICSKCGNKMVLRTAKTGIHKGKKCWGCSMFPHCKAISRY